MPRLEHFVLQRIKLPHCCIANKAKCRCIFPFFPSQFQSFKKSVTKVVPSLQFFNSTSQKLNLQLIAAAVNSVPVYFRKNIISFFRAKYPDLSRSLGPVFCARVLPKYN